MTHRKPHLPEKPCEACGRPFAWRKKWARDWDNVKTCSDRCKGELRRKSSPLAQAGTGASPGNPPRQRPNGGAGSPGPDRRSRDHAAE